MVAHMGRASILVCAVAHFGNFPAPVLDTRSESDGQSAYSSDINQTGTINIKINSIKANTSSENTLSREFQQKTRIFE